MPIVPKDQLVRLSKETSHIRNICILAHVDHGKTTLSDSLLATNGIISNKVAGKIRYLDSREDEQERGITMKSSAVALYFKLISAASAAAGGGVKENEFLIHLIDSPGHVDFSGEVSVASKLCDGALVLVDVIEGICTQTHVVLRQAWNEQVRPILVLNKIDRLIVELKLTTLEAYSHLLKIVEQANVIMESFRIEKRVLIESNGGSSSAAIPDMLDENLSFFDPLNGSVIFASAIDGWAFRLSDFLSLYADKLKVSDKDLLKGLWGNHVYSGKEAKIVQKKDAGQNSKNLFCQLILDNIWTIYDCTQLNYDSEKIEKVAASLKLKLNPFEMRSKDFKSITRSVMSQWLPLSKAALLSVISILPNPCNSQNLKFQPFINNGQSLSLNDLNNCKKCDINGEAVSFVAKMISVPMNTLSDYKQLLEARKKIEDENLTANDDEKKDEDVLIGFARIFSGSLKVGQKVYVLGPRYNPLKPEEHCQEVVIEGLYLIMGRHYESVEEAFAGNVIGIRGLHQHVLKWATLSSSKNCPSLGFAEFQTSNAVVRVALESRDPGKMPKLVEGLRLLNQADPAVEVLIQETGEHVLLTSGELHLERCVRDLKERFAKIDIHVSPPIVPFRETISTKLNKDGDDYAEVSTGHKYATIKIRCLPMDSELVGFINANSARIRSALEDDVAFADLMKTMEDKYKSINWKKLWSFGPKRTGPNLLINNINGFEHRHIGQSDKPSNDNIISEFENGILSGFQLATAAGPLCAEPLSGCIFMVDDVQINEEAMEENENIKASLSGQMITCMKEACKQAMLKWSPRLMLAMYSCEIQATSEVLGKVYAVLSKRHGRIVAEEMKEGTDLFTIKARMPVVDSFGFSDDIRKKTSGAAQPQLIFDKWEILDEDPFWVPTTEEELEDLGEKADRENQAKMYMDVVRKRKGLFVEKKLVEHAEKQRTLKIK